MKINKTKKDGTKDRRFFKKKGVAMYTKAGLELIEVQRQCLRCNNEFTAVGVRDGVKFIRVCNECKSTHKSTNDLAGF